MIKQIVFFAPLFFSVVAQAVGNGDHSDRPPPLFRAIDRVDFQWTQKLLTSGYSPNENFHNTTPLVKSAERFEWWRGNTDKKREITYIIIELLGWGADQKYALSILYKNLHNLKYNNPGMSPLLIKCKKDVIKDIENIFQHPAHFALDGNPAQHLLFGEAHGSGSRTARDAWKTRVNKWNQEQINRLKKEEETYAYMRQLFKTEED